MVPCISYWVKIIIQLVYNRRLLILFQFFWANKEFFITKFFNCHVETKGVRPKGTQGKKIPSPMYGLWKNNMLWHLGN
jgi:hypothetical protein